MTGDFMLSSLPKGLPHTGRLVYTTTGIQRYASHSFIHTAAQKQSKDVLKGMQSQTACPSLVFYLSWHVR